MFQRLFDKLRSSTDGYVASYQQHLNISRWRFRGDRDLAFAKAIGAESVEKFHEQGDGQVEVLKHYGLQDGMAIYDLGCGCGRTAQALQRSGWRGRYVGADIIPGFIAELKRKCPGYEAHVHQQPSIVADDASLDMIFHWSVFTHVSLEDCYLYLEDSFRALKPGGKLVFSFLELNDPEHYSVFESRLRRRRMGKRLRLLDTFLHRDWLHLFADKIGFEAPAFTDGHDGSDHPPMWQTLVLMAKPAAADQPSNS